MLYERMGTWTYKIWVLIVVGEIEDDDLQLRLVFFFNENPLLVVTEASR